MLSPLRFSEPLVIICILLQPSLSHADTCVLYHRRAPVKAVCGTVIDPAGERLKDVEVTLTNTDGSVVFSTHSDANENSIWSPIPQSTPRAIYQRGRAFGT